MRALELDSKSKQTKRTKSDPRAFYRYQLEIKSPSKRGNLKEETKEVLSAKIPQEII